MIEILFFLLNSSAYGQPLMRCTLLQPGCRHLSGLYHRAKAEPAHTPRVARIRDRSSPQSAAAMMVEQLVQSKLVLLGEMGSGKTSLVQRFVRGQYFENQVGAAPQCAPERRAVQRLRRSAERAGCSLPVLYAVKLGVSPTLSHR